MKIDEFINKANHNDEIVVNSCDSSIRVCDSKNDLLFRIPLDATSFLGIDWFASYADDFISKETSKYLSELIEEFLKTPIKERFPGKKYRLRWAFDSYGDTYYLDNSAGVWLLQPKRDAKQYTQQELDELKKINPQLAPAIDAMKEPVEDD